jgi:hypothetical protein
VPRGCRRGGCLGKFQVSRGRERAVVVAKLHERMGQCDEE